MNFHEDDRAQRLFDVFDVLDGQINVSYVNSTEHIVAWHKHKIHLVCILDPGGHIMRVHGGVLPLSAEQAAVTR